MPLSTISCEQIAPPTWESKTIPKLNGPEVHIWRIENNPSVFELSRLKELLSPEEHQKANKYLREQDKLSFIIGHACVRKLISYYLDINASQVILKAGPNGKPYFHSPGKLYFNISHSGNWVFIAFGTVELGVDIEKIAGNFITDSLLEQCFHKDELKVIKSSSDPTDEFFKFWTRKEAFLKATGNGIVDELKSFTCLDKSQTFLFPSLSKSLNWHLKSFQMNKSYSVSICAAHRLSAIRFMDF